jgi:hypothetical protein
MKQKQQAIHIDITFLYPAYKAVNKKRKLVMKFIFIFHIPIIYNNLENILYLYTVKDLHLWTFKMPIFNY